MNIWVEAARPKTLSAAITPVMVGSAAAERIIAWRAAAALIVALSIQIAVNFANDYFDGVRGVDTSARAGPRRAVASGLISPVRMKTAIAVALGVAAIAGLALAVAAGPWLIAVGAAAFIALLAYSGGPRPYASSGLGELFVFVFFGLVATTGSAYVHDESFSRLALLAAFPVGLLATAILVANNLRDIPTDAAAGKRTLAVRLGAQRTRSLYRALVLGAFPFVPVVAGVVGSAGAMLPVLSLPLVIPLLSSVERAGVELVPLLVGTARLQLSFGILLALGLWL